MPEILVPVDESPQLPAGTMALEEDLDVGVVSIAQDNETILPGFTSEEALLRWRARGGSFIGLDGKAFIQLALQHDFDGVVINPGHLERVEASRAELSALIQPS